MNYNNPLFGNTAKITKEQQIFSACNEIIRDWQIEEKSYILKNKNIMKMLISWYKSNLSDGCWTAGNLLFIRKLITQLN